MQIHRYKANSYVQKVFQRNVELGNRHIEKQQSILLCTYNLYDADIHKSTKTILVTSLILRFISIYREYGH